MRDHLKIDWTAFDRRKQALLIIVEDGSCYATDRVKAVCILSRMIELESNFHRIKSTGE